MHLQLSSIVHRIDNMEGNCEAHLQSPDEKIDHTSTSLKLTD